MVCLVALFCQKTNVDFFKLKLNRNLCPKSFPTVSAAQHGSCQDVWGVHGMGGFVGTLLLGVLADPEECGSIESAPAYCVNPGTKYLQMCGKLIKVDEFSDLWFCNYFVAFSQSLFVQVLEERWHSSKLVKSP